MTVTETNPSTKVLRPSPRSNRCWIHAPKPSSRSSIRSSEPAIPPISIAPSTISTGALSPTASLRT